eukprot:Platyproteum_vivax@DN6341_c0_g1_i3.p1
MSGRHSDLVYVGGNVRTPTRKQLRTATPRSKNRLAYEKLMDIRTMIALRKVAEGEDVRGDSSLQVSGLSGVQLGSIMLNYSLPRVAKERGTLEVIFPGVVNGVACVEVLVSWGQFPWSRPYAMEKDGREFKLVLKTAQHAAATQACPYPPMGKNYYRFLVNGEWVVGPNTPSHNYLLQVGDLHRRQSEPYIPEISEVALSVDAKRVGLAGIHVLPSDAVEYLKLSAACVTKVRVGLQMRGHGMLTAAPHKEETEDACFLANGDEVTNGSLGVADGVGDLRKYGLNPALFARELMESCVAQYRNIYKWKANGCKGRSVIFCPFRERLLDRQDSAEVTPGPMLTLSLFSFVESAMLDRVNGDTRRGGALAAATPPAATSSAASFRSGAAPQPPTDETLPPPPAPAQRRKQFCNLEGASLQKPFLKLGIANRGSRKNFYGDSSRPLCTHGVEDACPMGMMEIARDGAESYGASTCCVLCVHDSGSGLTVANMGDSGMRLLRRAEHGGYKIVGKTDERQHQFNCPHQFSQYPNPMVIDLMAGASTGLKVLSSLLKHPCNKNGSGVCGRPLLAGG